MNQLPSVVCVLTLLLLACDQRAGAVLGGSEASAKRIASYAAAMAPLLEGRYGGNCMTMAGPAPQEGVAISAAGQLSAAGFLRELAAIDDTLVLSRTLRGGVAVSAMVLATSHSPKWTLGINSDGAQRSAMFGDGEAMTSCQQVAQPGLMRVHGIYPSLAALFAAGPATLPCLIDLTSTRELAVSAGPKGVTVDGKLISLARNMKKESAAVVARTQTLSYNAEFDDGTQLSISVDASGKISEVSSTRRGKAAFICNNAQAALS